MLEHDESAIEKLVIGVVVRGEGPSTDGSFNDDLAIYVKMEIPTNVSGRSPSHRLYIRRFKRVAYCLRVTDASHEIRHHRLAQICVRFCVVYSDPRQLPIALSSQKACFFSRELLL